jgi:hypothetical protein
MMRKAVKLTPRRGEFRLGVTGGSSCDRAVRPETKNTWVWLACHVLDRIALGGGICGGLAPTSGQFSGVNGARKALSDPAGWLGSRRPVGGDPKSTFHACIPRCIPRCIPPGIPPAIPRCIPLSLGALLAGFPALFMHATGHLLTHPPTHRVEVERLLEAGDGTPNQG